MDSDLANWRQAHLRALWRERLTARRVEWIYTWGRRIRAPGRIYRSNPLGVRAAMHPSRDLVASQARYVAGPSRPRPIWRRGEYARCRCLWNGHREIVFGERGAPQKTEQTASPSSL